MDDETLGQAAPTGTDDDTLATVPTVDVSKAPTVEDFDFDEWLSGVRGTRRAVRVYARADLVAEMEKVAEGYHDDLPAKERRRIADEVLALREQFEASGAWFVTEARSNERIKRVRDASAKRRGITLPADDATGDEAMIPVADWTLIERDLLVDAIVSPAVDFDGLSRLAEVAPTEYVKLAVAMRQANSALAQNAGVVTRDFSPAPSASRATGGSKRR